MKKNEILNQYYENYADNITSFRIVKFYDKDVDNNICIIKISNTINPYVFMDIKSGWIFGQRFNTLKAIRNYKMSNINFAYYLTLLNEVRHTARYQQLVDRYDEMIKSYERTHKQ